jgi:hypothetical protein
MGHCGGLRRCGSTRGARCIMNISDWCDSSKYQILIITQVVFWRAPNQTLTASCHIYCRDAHRRHVRVQALVHTEYRRAFMVHDTFSGSGPVGLPPFPWTEKTTEREVGRAKDLAAPR